MIRRYHITRAYYRGNRCARIMNARVEYTRNENDIRDGWEKYTIFVMIRTETKPNCPSSPHKATTDPEPTAPASPSPPARPRTSRDKATQLTTNKKANAHAQNYIPTVTAANMLPILEAHVGPVHRLSITGADHTAFAINSSFEPIITHFTYDPDSPLYYTVEQVATIHNGLTPTIFATPLQWFGELAHSFTADMENTKQRDYWTTLAVTGMTLMRDGSTIQLSHQHPFAQKTGSTTLRVIKNRIHLVDGHDPRPKRTRHAYTRR